VTSKSRLLYEDLGPENDDHSRVGEDQPEIILVATHSPIYGVTTGFGDSVGFHISPKTRRAPAEHNCLHLKGTGPVAPADVIPDMRLPPNRGGLP
jgi:hypothetical protein